MIRLVGGFALVCCALVRTSDASASPPAGLVAGLDGLLGFGWTTVNESVADIERDFTQKHVGSGMFAAYGYSIPQLTLDYVWQGGLSVGGAFGAFYSSSDERGEDVSVTSFLLELRAGYYLQLGRRVALWPKLGVVNRSSDPGEGPRRSHTALALQVPFVLRGEEQRVWPFIGPYLDLGLGGGYDDVDQRVTELGLSLGLQLW
jgi:hypothetical protein